MAKIQNHLQSFYGLPIGSGIIDLPGVYPASTNEHEGDAIKSTKRWGKM